MASKMIGTTVVSANNESVGDINDVIVDRQGRAVAVVIGVGGFLGIGEKSVAMKLDRLQMTEDPKGGGLQLTMDVKKDELANAPSFKSRRDQEAERQAFERARNQPKPGSATSNGSGAKPGQN